MAADALAMQLATVLILTGHTEFMLSNFHLIYKPHTQGVVEHDFIVHCLHIIFQYLNCRV